MNSKSLLVSHPTGILNGRVVLPASKSESNRALIIEALSGAGSKLDNLSEANDTRVITRLLQEKADELNAEDAGTVMRFMTAYLAVSITWGRRAIRPWLSAVSIRTEAIRPPYRCGGISAASIFPPY
jgi:5-enolpyruvylshikimate-3-phosphate synthase